MSTMRKRNCVMDAPVEFLNLRRMVSVPSGLFVPVSLASRTRLGGAVDDAPMSISAVLISALRCTGLLRFSGAGAPSKACSPS